MGRGRVSALSFCAHYIQLLISMTWVVYDTARKRLWIAGKRIHHGAVGCALLVVGAVLMADDWKDIPWLKDNS